MFELPKLPVECSWEQWRYFSQALSIKFWLNSKILIDNLYKSIYGPVRSEYSSDMVHNADSGYVELHNRVSKLGVMYNRVFPNFNCYYTSAHNHLVDYCLSGNPNLFHPFLVNILEGIW